MGCLEEEGAAVEAIAETLSQDLLPTAVGDQEDGDIVEESMLGPPIVSRRLQEGVVQSSDTADSATNPLSTDTPQIIIEVGETAAPAASPYENSRDLTDQP